MQLQALILTVWQILIFFHDTGRTSNISSLKGWRWYFWQLWWDSTWAANQSKYWHHFWQIRCDNNWVAICTERANIENMCQLFLVSPITTASVGKTLTLVKEKGWENSPYSKKLKRKNQASKNTLESSYVVLDLLNSRPAGCYRWLESRSQWRDLQLKIRSANISQYQLTSKYQPISADQ